MKSKYDLTPFYAKQKELDQSIIDKHHLLPMDSTYFLQRSILSFCVEFSEAINVHEFFKDWKNTRGTKIDEKFQSEEFAHFSNEKKHHLTVVEEFSDSLHFLLSIGNAIDKPIDLDSNVVAYHEKRRKYPERLIHNANMIYYVAQSIIRFPCQAEFHYNTLLNQFSSMIYLCDVSWEELLKMYSYKYDINQQRQKENY